MLYVAVISQVLETSWHKLVKDLKAAKDLDELIDSHEDYIAAIKKNVSVTVFSLLLDVRGAFDLLHNCACYYSDMFV